jgi:membrane-bound lytic murein transglycosylase D
MSRRLLFLLPLLAPPLLAQTPPPAEDDMFALGQELFETYAPAEIKKDYAFPSRAQWDDFVARLEKTRATGSFADLAAFEPEARSALAALRILPLNRGYADWLEQRIGEIVVARNAVALAGQRPPPPRDPRLPAPPRRVQDDVPLYDLWVGRVRAQPRPARADEFVADMKTIFAAEGVPAELAWIAETESMFNPDAESPAGARGLYQFMPVTAKAEGLSLFPFDERTHPEKSARAAASLLRRLHGQFGSWPLTLAAYNAGEGRVRRTLKAQNARTFAQIADALPTETRLYVPKVLATVSVREGVEPSNLPAPKTK